MSTAGCGDLYSLHLLLLLLLTPPAYVAAPCARHPPVHTATLLLLNAHNKNTPGSLPRGVDGVDGGSLVICQGSLPSAAKW